MKRSKKLMWPVAAVLTASLIFPSTGIFASEAATNVLRPYSQTVTVYENEPNEGAVEASNSDLRWMNHCFF